MADYRNPNQVFPGGGTLPRTAMLTPGQLEQFNLEQQDVQRQRMAQQREAAWAEEIQRQQQLAENEARSRRVEEQFGRMRKPIFRPDPAASTASSVPVLPEAEPPVDGAPLEPLQQEQPTVASDVPPAPEEVRINPYTGQPFRTTQDTRNWQPAPVNPATGIVMDPYANMNREQSLFGGLVTAGPMTRVGLPGAQTIANPYADSSLTPQQQSEQAIIQRAAREKAFRDKQANAAQMFGAKWKAAQKFISDPLTSPESKWQVMDQMQQELAQHAEPSPLDTYQAALAERSVDAQCALMKDVYRKMGKARGATDEEADYLAGMVSVVGDRVDVSVAEKMFDRIEALSFEKKKYERQRDGDIHQSKTKLMDAAFTAAQTKSEDHIAAYRALVNDHVKRFGGLPGPDPGANAPFSFSAETRRIFGDVEAVTANKASATAAAPGVIDVHTQADVDRAKLEVARARQRGDRNFVIRLRDPNTGKIKILRAF